MLRRTAIGLVLALLVALPVTATNHRRVMPVDEPLAEKAFKFYQKQFQGWTGIAFSCVVFGSKKPFDGKLCDTAETDAEFLAATAKVPLAVIDMKSSGNRAIKVYLKRKVVGSFPLDFELEIRSTASSGYVGISIHTTASKFYSDAVEKAKVRGPQSAPKSGTLHLWDSSSIASGTVNQALRSVIEAENNKNLKRFFTLFVKHWKKPKVKK